MHLCYVYITSCVSRLFFVTGKTFCQSCKKKCSGEVLRVQDKYFHIGCFKCAQCNASLAQGGFFAREGSYYCTKVLENKKIRNQSYVKSLIKTEKTSIMRIAINRSRSLFFFFRFKFFFFSFYFETFGRNDKTVYHLEQFQKVSIKSRVKFVTKFSPLQSPRFILVRK